MGHFPGTAGWFTNTVIAGAYTLDKPGYRQPSRLALAAEAAEPDIMQRPPRKPAESIFAKGLGIHVLWVGVFIGLLSVGTQWVAIESGDEHWQTMVFTVLCFSQLWHVMAIRSEKQSIFKTGFAGNKPLFLAVSGTVLLQLAVIYIPFCNSFFHTQPLTVWELLIIIGVSFIVFIVVEIEKSIKRRISNKNR